MLFFLPKQNQILVEDSIYEITKYLREGAQACFENRDFRTANPYRDGSQRWYDFDAGYNLQESFEAGEFPQGGHTE